MGYLVEFRNVETDALLASYTAVKNVRFSALQLSGDNHFVQNPRRCRFLIYRESTDAFLDGFFSTSLAVKGELVQYRVVVKYDGEQIFEGLPKLPVKNVVSKSAVSFTCYDYLVLLNRIRDTERSFTADETRTIETVLAWILQAAQDYFDNSYDIFSYSFTDYSELSPVVYDDEKIFSKDDTFTDLLPDPGGSYVKTDYELSEGLVLQSSLGTPKPVYRRYYWAEWKDNGNTTYTFVVRTVEFLSTVIVSILDFSNTGPSYTWDWFYSNYDIGQLSDSIVDDYGNLYSNRQFADGYVDFTGTLFLPRIVFANTEDISYGDLLKLILFANNLTMICDTDGIVKLKNKDNPLDNSPVELSESSIRGDSPSRICAEAPSIDILDKIKNIDYNPDSTFPITTPKEKIDATWDDYFTEIMFELKKKVYLPANAAYNNVVLHKLLSCDGVIYQVKSITPDHPKNIIDISAWNKPVYGAFTSGFADGFEVGSG